MQKGSNSRKALGVYLFRYLDEQSYRYNTRKGTDGNRFEQVVTYTLGKRLTYNELTGATATSP